MKGMMYDYLARLNIEEGRKAWLRNHPKIEYIFNKTEGYLKPGMSVCEIGIGDGYLLRLLDRCALKVTGIDISSYLVEKLSKTFKDEGLEIELLQSDISESIALENTFSAVFCLDLLEHIKNLEKAIENVSKILKKEGILIATLPWKENLADNMVVCPKCGHEFHRVGHFHSFHCYEDITQLLGDNFQIVKFCFIPRKGLQNICIDILRKTIFRKKYYKGRLPNFRNTCFLIARHPPIKRLYNTNIGNHIF